MQKLKGNPAISEMQEIGETRPVAFRPYHTIGLAFSKCGTLIQRTKKWYDGGDLIHGKHFIAFAGAHYEKSPDMIVLHTVHVPG